MAMVLTLVQCTKNPYLKSVWDNIFVINLFEIYFLGLNSLYVDEDGIMLT